MAPKSGSQMPLVSLTHDFETEINNPPMATHEAPLRESFLGETSGARHAPAATTEACARDLETGKRPEIAEDEKSHHPASRFHWRELPSRVWKPEEVRQVEFYRDIFVEFLGTLLFVFFGVAAIVLTDFKFSGAVGKLGIAFAFGLTIFAVVYSSAGISGGHINPAITLAMFLAGRISALKGSLYICAQMVGAICGAAIVHAVNKSLFSKTNGGCNFVQPGYDKDDALGVEIIGTFVLIYTVFAATDPVRSCREGSPHVSALAPFAIGVAVFIVHIGLIPVDGVSINPARSFGTAVIYNKDFVWDDQWIFWVGPSIGALIAAIIYEWVIRGADFRSMQRKYQ